MLGSAYFIQHPPFKLSDIALLINLDLVGSGSQGIMLQGFPEHPKFLQRASDLNSKLFNFELRNRANSPNSDHYYFAAKGLPAFFLYAYPGTSPYHHIDDTAEKLDPFVLENIAKFVLAYLWDFAENQ